MNEFAPQPEQESLPYHSRVMVHIFRHGKKEGEKAGVPDEAVVLAPLGRQQAQAKGEAVQPQKDVAMALGSERVRSQETAARAILHDEISPDMDFASLQEKVTSSFGQKMVSDPRLNFISNLDTPLGKLGDDAYNNKRYLDFMLKESDAIALREHDSENSTLTRLAASVADLVKKYVRVSDTFDTIVSQKPEKYAQFKNQMERYMGTHQGVTESFLAKVLEKLGKQNEIYDFIAQSPAGFSETQGISLEITHRNNETRTITLNYELADGPKSVEITEERLDEIITDGKAFEAKIKLTPTQETVIKAYLGIDEADPLRDQKLAIFKEYLASSRIDPETFRQKPLSELTTVQQIEAIKEKFQLLRGKLINQAYRQQLDEQERQELAPFSRLDETA